MRAIFPAVAVAAIFGVVAWQVGCGPDNGYVSEDKFAQEYAEALCTSLQPCCSENAVSFNYSACETGWRAAIENLVYGPTSAGNYNATLATKCIAEVRAAQNGGCQPVPGSLSAARDDCQAVFAGITPLGAPCTSAAQCAPMDGSIISCAAPSGGSAEGGGGGGELPLAAPGVSLQNLTLSPEDVPVCVAEVPPDGGTAMMTGPPCSIQAEAGTDTCTAMGMYCDPKMLTCTGQAPAGGACDPSVVASCQSGNYCTPAGGGPARASRRGPWVPLAPQRRCAIRPATAMSRAATRASPSGSPGRLAVPDRRARSASATRPPTPA